MRNVQDKEKSMYPKSGYQLVFPFFACAKKGTKKAQPILMQKISHVDHSSAKIGLARLNSSEHFILDLMQDDLNYFG